MKAVVVHVSNPAKREIRKLTRDTQVLVIKTLDELALNPFPKGAEKLQGRPAYLRVRCGNFRIIYSVQKSPPTVVILVVRDRKDAFKGLEDLDAKLANALMSIADSILSNVSIAGSA